MRARLQLHLAAALLPPVAVIAAVVSMAGWDDVDESWTLSAVAVLAAQFAVLACWPLLARTARRAWGWAAAVGALMGLLTHLLFGLLFALGNSLLHPSTALADLLLGVWLFGLISVMVAGWATVPAVALLCIWIHRLRRQELGLAQG
jgi:hypothetical protein